MATLADDFIPQKGINSIFSELENFELAQNPYDEGFLGATATLKKRPGLLSSDDWQTDGDILGKIILGGVSWVRDDLGKVYRFEKIDDEYTMTKVFDNPGPAPVVSVYSTDLAGKKVKQTAEIAPYLVGFEKAWTADKVLSTNDDGSGNVVLAVNEAGTFATTSVGKYIYFKSTASEKAKFQIRQIVQYVDGKTVYLSEQFYGDPADWAASEPGELYTSIDSIIVFNNLRKSTGEVLCISADISSEITYRNLGGIDVKIFEGRRWTINSYGTSVGGSVATGEYEILDTDTILGSSTDARGQKMNSLNLFKNYLLINMENSISAVWQIGSSETGVPIYSMNNILSGISAFGPDAIGNKDGGLYFLGRDRVFNSGDILAVSTNIIQGTVSNQGIVIGRFLSSITDNDYVRVYSYGKGIVISWSNATKTTMLMYDDIYEGRLPQIYNGFEITDKFESFYGDLLICVGNNICIRAGNSDLGENISVKCVITGSKQVINSLFSLKKIKLMLGYFLNIMKFKITVDLGKQVFIGRTEKQANGVEYLIWQNIAAGGGGIGQIPLGYVPLGEGGNLVDGIAKIGLLGIPIGKKCTYYKITLENIDNFDLNICGITSLIEDGNPFVTPLQNVF